MSIHRTRSLRRSLAASCAWVALLLPATALASPAGGGAGLAWESSVDVVLDSILGKAPTILTVAFVIAGLIWAYGEGAGASRRVVNLVAGGALAIGAAPTITALFQGASGLLF